MIAQQLIHHIQRKHHGLAHLDQLKREIEVALYIRRIDDVDYRIRSAVDYEIARHLFLAGVRADGVDARQIDKLVIFPAYDLAYLMLDRDAGEVADVLI